MIITIILIIIKIIILTIATTVTIKNEDNNNNIYLQPDSFPSFWSSLNKQLFPTFKALDKGIDNEKLKLTIFCTFLLQSVVYKAALLSS